MTNHYSESNYDRRGANRVVGCSPRLSQLSYSNVYSPKQGIETKPFETQNLSKWKVERTWGRGMREFEQAVIL